MTALLGANEVALDQYERQYARQIEEQEEREEVMEREAKEELHYLLSNQMYKGETCRDCGCKIGDLGHVVVEYDPYGDIKYHFYCHECSYGSEVRRS